MKVKQSFQDRILIQDDVVEGNSFGDKRCRVNRRVEKRIRMIKMLTFKCNASLRTFFFPHMQVPLATQEPACLFAKSTPL